LGKEEVYTLRSCQVKGHYPDVKVGDAIFLAVIALFVTLNILGTLLYMLNFSKPQWLLNFSFISNGMKILDTQTSMKKGQISCLNGFRFWSMAWVLSGHTYSQSYFLRLPVVNLVQMATEVRTYVTGKIHMKHILLLSVSRAISVPIHS